MKEKMAWMNNSPIVVLDLVAWWYVELNVPVEAPFFTSGSTMAREISRVTRVNPSYVHVIERSMTTAV